RWPTTKRSGNAADKVGRVADTPPLRRRRRVWRGLSGSESARRAEELVVDILFLHLAGTQQFIAVLQHWGRSAQIVFRTVFSHQRGQQGIIQEAFAIMLAARTVCRAGLTEANVHPQVAMRRLQGCQLRRKGTCGAIDRTLDEDNVPVLLLS